MPLDPETAERITDLEEMHADEPEDALTAFLLGTEYVKAGRSGDALPMFRAAIAADPGYSAARAGIGACLETAGRLDEARAIWAETAVLAEAKGDHMVTRQAQDAMARLA